MIRKLRIAVDHGNKNMKTCNQVFTTALITQDKKPARGEEYIFYEGKYYLLSNRRIPYQRDKTEDERFLILTLFAIVLSLIHIWTSFGRSGSHDLLKKDWIRSFSCPEDVPASLLSVHACRCRLFYPVSGWKYRNLGM